MRTPSNKRGATPSHAQKRSDDGDAFFPDPESGPARAPDDLAEELAEEFLSGATGADAVDEHDEVVPEEVGGPFVETDGDAEYADGTDLANPDDADREPFPNVGASSQRSPNEVRWPVRR